MTKLVRLVCLTVLGLSLVTPAQAQDLRKATQDLATKVKELIKESKVRIGRFTPTGQDGANAGDGIGAELAVALGASVDPKASLEVKGDYGFFQDEANPALRVVRIDAKVVNLDTGKALSNLTLEAVVRNNPDIARLLNYTGPLDPKGDQESRNKELQRRNGKKTVFIDGSLVSSSQDSPYAVELRVKPLKDHDKHTAQPRAAKDIDGQAFVAIDQGELYEVRIVNRARHEVAVTLHIDGLDVFTFSEERDPQSGRPRFSHFIVPPAQDDKPGSGVIVGWQKTIVADRKDKFLAFLVTENGKGAASKFPTLTQGKVGVLTLSFSRSYPKGSRAGETGFGPEIDRPVKAVERDIDPAHDFVTIRYQR